LKLFLFLAIGVSLLAASSVVVQNANSATLVTKSESVVSDTQPLKLRLLLTAYVPDEGARTATGRNANHPGIAADFATFPPGTEIFIPGKGTFKVDDTGGAMRQDAKQGIRHIDLRIPPSNTAHHHAMAIGKRWIDAYVILAPNR
jgi:3D (Asp-Asp-Asp) domain-containing protein